jgi:hypothetical protein
MERVATAVSLVAVAAVMLLAAIHREAPYRVISRPLESRIHFGKDEDAPSPALQQAKPAAAAGPAEEAP